MKFKCIGRLALAATLAAGSMAALAVGVPGQGTWETTLKARDINADGRIDAYYDTALKITWLAYANAIGSRDWSTATAWADGLNVFGVTGWRLPSTVDDPSSHGIDAALPPFDSSEIGHLYWVTLANPTGPGFPEPTNTGPFRNLTFGDYWSSTEVINGATDPERDAWDFYFDGGGNNYRVEKSDTFPYAWAVHDGNVSAVPEPATGALVLAGLAAIVATARRRNA